MLFAKKKLKANVSFLFGKRLVKMKQVCNFGCFHEIQTEAYKTR